MKPLKIFITILLFLSIIFTFSGCDILTQDSDNLLVAPKLTGEMQPIQEALEKGIGSTYSLKFPAMGESKTAITLVDLNGDSKREAVAFYSTSEKGTVTMHIAVIENKDGIWAMTGMQSVVAGGVERVYFKDMDSDGTLEIVVGWNVYSSVEKKVVVYKYTEENLIGLLDEAYYTFLICDIDETFSLDLLVITLDFSSSRSFGKYFSFTADGVNTLGISELDGNVSSYNEPILGKMSGGKFCVYIDSIKGVGMITEILYFGGGQLQNTLYDEERMETYVTYRPALVPCRDFDSDGEIDVPIMVALPNNELSSSVAYLTVWNSFDGVGFTPKIYTLMNYTDGYLLKISEKLAGETTTMRNLENRERIIYRYDYEKSKLLDELFRIRVVSRQNWESGAFNGTYFGIIESDSQVWLGSITEAGKDYGITEQNLKDMFEFIVEE